MARNCSNHISRRLIPRCEKCASWPITQAQKSSPYPGHLSRSSRRAGPPLEGSGAVPAVQGLVLREKRVFARGAGVRSVASHASLLSRRKKLYAQSLFPAKPRCPIGPPSVTSELVLGIHGELKLPATDKPSLGITPDIFREASAPSNFR